ncbi:MAG: rhodanese [Fuerstiella sp.]|nr:rhodanese [Fuerstiella sp.]
MSSIEIDCQSVKARLDSSDSFLLLDCREQSEWDHVHIQGAILLPMSEIQDRVDELEHHRNCDVVVHCHHGGRSLQVARWLLRQGFSSVFNMTGGIDVWAQEIDNSLPRY